MKRSFLLVSAALAVTVIAGAAYALCPLGKGSDETVAIELGTTYRNPFQLAGEWPDYGIGDPYVMRHNGKYYLYCSTKDFRVGVKAWSSINLTDWKYEGLVTEAPLTEGAYAPEVVYWNGWFYMYTSPAGKGHYVLRSSSPTGPFAVQTENLGLSIDGSVFMDDDGRWYFTRADFGGIMGHPMKDPYSMDTGVKLNTSMGHWTEGSMILKRNGRYYMTYTGNHVFSKGYRINYAVARDGPLGLYQPGLNNPIIISTAESFNGLGHSSTALGPDLDSYYLFYHNLTGRSAEGPPVRMLNMDRLLFNGDKLGAAGPTRTDNPVPAMPVFYDTPGDRPSSDKWTQTEAGGIWTLLSIPETKKRFTAEYNLSAPSDQAYDLVFSYQDERHFRSLRIHPESMTATYLETREGKETINRTAKLMSEMDLTKLHTVRIESADEKLRIYWDGMKMIEDGPLMDGSGRIGYRTSGKVRPQPQFTAFSDHAGGSSDYEAVKLVPGTIEAVHYMEGKDRGFHSGTKSENSPIRRKDGLKISGEEDGTYSLELTQEGDWVNYPVNVTSDGEYLLAAMTRATGKDVLLDIGIDGVFQRIIVAPSAFSSGSWAKVPLGRLKLQKGAHTLTVKLVQGAWPFRFLETAPVAPIRGDSSTRWLEQTDLASIFGGWDQSEDGHYSVTAPGRDSKWFFGDHGWTDYKVSATIRRLTPETLDEAAILIRTNHESDFPHQVKDAFAGYEIAFRNDRVLLRKINYEQVEEAASGILEFAQAEDAAQDVTVEARGNSIRVFSGSGKGKPLIEWTDSNVFLNGRAGLRTSSPDWSFSDVVVTAADIQD